MRAAMTVIDTDQGDSSDELEEITRIQRERVRRITERRPCGLWDDPSRIVYENIVDGLREAQPGAV